MILLSSWIHFISADLKMSCVIVMPSHMHKYSMCANFYPFHFEFWKLCIMLIVYSVISLCGVLTKWWRIFFCYRRINALHVTDILFLYGEDFRQHSYNMRMEAAQLFVTSIHKPSRTRLTPVRVKQLYRIEDIPGLISNNLEYRYKYLTEACKRVLLFTCTCICTVWC